MAGEKIFATEFGPLWETFVDRCNGAHLLRNDFTVEHFKKLWIRKQDRPFDQIFKIRVDSGSNPRI